MLFVQIQRIKKVLFCLWLFCKVMNNDGPNWLLTKIGGFDRKWPWPAPKLKATDFKIRNTHVSSWNSNCPWEKAKTFLLPLKDNFQGVVNENFSIFFQLHFFHGLFESSMSTKSAFGTLRNWRVVPISGVWVPFTSLSYSALAFRLTLAGAWNQIDLFQVLRMVIVNVKTHNVPATRTKGPAIPNCHRGPFIFRRGNAWCTVVSVWHFITLSILGDAIASTLAIICIISNSTTRSSVGILSSNMILTMFVSKVMLYRKTWRVPGAKICVCLDKKCHLEGGGGERLMSARRFAASFQHPCTIS